MRMFKLRAMRWSGRIEKMENAYRILFWISERDYMEELILNEKIISTWILREQDRKIFAGFISLGTGTVAGFCEHVDGLRVLWNLENLLSNCETTGYEEVHCCLQIAPGSASGHAYLLNA
jgi:hypothetical protein